MKAVLVEYRKTWDKPRREYKRHIISGDTGKQLFSKAYAYVRSMRYCSDVIYEFEDEELQEKFKKYRSGVSIEEYYGGAIVD